MVQHYCYGDPMRIVKMTHNPRYTGINSSSKERQLKEKCVSIGKECTAKDLAFSHFTI